MWRSARTGRRIVSGGADQTVRAVGRRPPDAPSATRSPATPRPVRAVAFSPDGAPHRLRRRRRHGAGVGRRHRPADRRAADRPHRWVWRVAFSPDEDRHRLRRRRRHGAGVGRGHRRAERPVAEFDGRPRPRRRGDECGVQPGRAPHRLRQRRPHAAGVGRRHRPCRSGRR